MKKLSLIGVFFFATMFSAQASDLEVKGKVADKETGQMLKNCHVFINAHFGTITDEQGAFTLEIPEEYEGESLTVSYLGYETYQVPVKQLKGDFMKINLVFGVTMLDDVVVVSPDPWDDFRTIIGEISSDYDNKRELMAAVFSELNNFDFPNNEKTVIATEKTGYRGQKYEGAGFLPGIIAFCIASLGLVFMAKPFIRMIDKSNKSDR